MQNRHPLYGYMTERYFEAGTGAVQIDSDSPDRIVARSEPLHPDDIDFDHDLLPDDTMDEISLGKLDGIPRDALTVLLEFIIPTLRPRRWDVARIRLGVLAHLAGAHGLGGSTLSSIADELRVTRSIVSLHHLRIIDSLGFDKSRSGKGRASRQVYSEAATAAHRRAGHRMNEA